VRVREHGHELKIGDLCRQASSVSETIEPSCQSRWGLRMFSKESGIGRGINECIIGEHRE
jgi:hypothetical protein